MNERRTSVPFGTQSTIHSPPPTWAAQHMNLCLMYRKTPAQIAADALAEQKAAEKKTNSVLSAIIYDRTSGLLNANIPEHIRTAICDLLVYYNIDTPKTEDKYTYEYWINYFNR